MNMPPEPTRITSEKVKYQGTRSQGTHDSTTGAASAHVTCENVVRDTFLAALKAISLKEREGGLDTDQYSFISSLPPSRDTNWAKGSTHGTHEPASSCQRTQDSYAEPGPPRRTGHPDTRGQARPP